MCGTNNFHLEYSIRIVLCKRQLEFNIYFICFIALLITFYCYCNQRDEINYLQKSEIGKMLHKFIL